MIKRFIIVAVIAAALIGGISWFHFMFLPKMIEQAIRGAPPPAETVSAEPARVEQWADYVRAIGTVTASAGVNIAPKTGGVVREVAFRSGQPVAAGQLLFQIDDAQERADLAAQQAALRNAELDLGRLTQLRQKGFAAQADLDAAQSRHDQAKAAADRLAAVIADKAVSAPWAGEAGIAKVDPGTYVAPGTALVWLQTVDPVFIDFAVPEQEFAKLKIGQKVGARVEAWPGEVFSGAVTAIEPRIASDTRAFSVRASFANAGRKLAPGMFANVNVEVSAPADVVTIARTGVTYSLYGDSAFVVTEAPKDETRPDAPPDFVVDRRFIRVGEVRDNRVLVLEGVKAGDQVVTSGQLKLRPGAHVKIDNSVALDLSGERKTE